eukprot:608509-Rhodomonas_salina.2
MPEEDVGRVYSQRKLDFAERLEGLLKDYAKVPLPALVALARGFSMFPASVKGSLIWAVTCGRAGCEHLTSARDTANQVIRGFLPCVGGWEQVLIISADNVGSQQMHVVRAELRNGSGPKAQILMGKNTMIKFIIRRFAASDPAYAPFNKLADLCTLNVGLVFTNDDPKDVRNIVEKNK